jgi:hypothetical protein
MINFSICKKCVHCSKLTRGRTEKNGDLTVRPHVQCGVGQEPAYLMLDDDTPQGCKYALQHTLSTQNLSPALALSLSGRKADFDE